MRRHLGFTVQRLALLDLIDHLTSIHLNLPSILSEAVEALCEGVSEMSSKKAGQSSSGGI